jgi:hypothetical protein
MLQGMPTAIKHSTNTMLLSCVKETTANVLPPEQHVVAENGIAL